MPYRPTELTETRKARAREAIVAAALDQLADGGYASATVQAVAARAGVADGELEPHDTGTVAAALIGAIGEALVGPLSPASDHGPRRHESLIAALVQFCDNALPRKEHKRAHARANA